MSAHVKSKEIQDLKKDLQNAKAMEILHVEFVNAKKAFQATNVNVMNPNCMTIVAMMT